MASEWRSRQINIYQHLILAQKISIEAKSSKSLMTSWTSTVWLSFLHDGSWRYQLFFWHWQVAGVIRLATRQSRCKNHQLKLKLAKPQIRRRKASRSMLFIIIFKFGYSNYTTRRCFYQNRWLFFLYLSLTVN